MGVSLKKMKAIPRVALKPLLYLIQQRILGDIKKTSLTEMQESGQTEQTGLGEPTQRKDTEVLGEKARLDSWANQFRA